MKNKKVKALFSAFAVIAAAGGGICCAVKHGEKKKTEAVTEDEPVPQEEGLTEEKVRECFLRLFRLYEDSEFDDLAEFLGDGSDPREYAADNYSGQLFPYLKKNMKDVMKLEGDDGTGKEPFSMTDALFSCPACMIGCAVMELFSDSFVLCLEREMWMLENGESASVCCISMEKDGGRVSYRFLDRYIKNPGDIPICFDDLECVFSGIIRVLECGRVPKLP